MTGPGDPDFAGVRRVKPGRASSIDLLLILLALAVLAGPLFFLFFSSMHW